MIGTKLAHYEITCHLGTGGMGEVYQATDSKLARSVAVKFLPEAFSHDSERVARFEREARMLASLNHPHIAGIYGLEESGERKFLVMELVEGETLAERIKRGPIPVDESLSIAKQICQALEAAHEKGIVHRDLKPGNVKITPDGKVKVLDFGLAKAFEAEASQSNVSQSPTLSMAATNAGMILGTAAYMSPEQVKGQQVDRRTDIFAFGAVLYEMFTGRGVFEGEDVQDILGAVLKSEPDWKRLPSDVPASIRKLLRLCLEKNAKNRRSDATDVRLDIEQALTEPAAVTSTSSPARSSTLGWIVAALAVLVAVALAIPAVRYLRETSPSEMRVEINTPATGSALHFALSPDGLKLAFVAGEGAGLLWLRPLDKADAQPLAGTDGAQYPFWSPDSRSIGFFASGKLYRIDITGSRPQALTDAPTGRGGTWNQDGVIVFAPTNLGPLVRVAASGGEPVPLTSLDAPRSASHRYPQFLPDGRHFLFYAQLPAAGVYWGTLDGGEPKMLMANATAGAYLSPGMLIFVRQGALTVRRLDIGRGELTGDPETLADPVGEDLIFNLSGFSVSANGRVAYRAGGIQRQQFCWYDRTGKAVGVAGEPDANNLLTTELSPDGRRLAVDRFVQNNRDVWLLDLERSGMTRFTFSTAIDQGSVWSPDGMRIVFQSQKKGPGGVYVKSSSGTGTEEPLLETPNVKWPQDWSRDGRFLLYAEEDQKAQFDLNALPLTGNERKPRVVANTPFDERQAQFSPDGRWVAYATNESGRFEIVVQPFPEPIGKWQVSTAGGIEPRWRADGCELYFIAPDAKLMAVSVTASGATFQATPPVALFQTRIRGGGTGAPTKPLYTVSSDGRFLILQVVEEATVSPITLLLNWSPKPRK